MPRELITVQVGQCGNQLGLKWWDLLLQEHLASPQYPEAVDSLFFRTNENSRGAGGKQSGSGALKARCISIDMEEGVLNAIQRGPLRSLFDATHFISDVSGAGNNWAVGHMEYGDKYVDSISESVRLMTEKCDCLQTFVVMHSLSGGTGSGLGTRVLELLREEYPHIFRFCPVVMPSDVEDVVIAPYNSCFALRQLIEQADCILPLDNDALARAADRALGRPQNSAAAASAAAGGGAASSGTRSGAVSYSVADPTRNKNLPFDTMNAIAAQMLSNLTCSMRFPGTMNMDINEVTTNLVPYPHLSLLTSAIAPLSVTRQNLTGAKNLDAMFRSCLDKDHQLVSYDDSITRWTSLASALIARGPGVSVGDISRNVGRLHERMKMIYWNQDGFKTALCDVPPLGHEHSLLMLTNSCAIAGKVQRLQEKFMRLYVAKSHVHHYTEFVELSYFDATMDTLSMVVEDYNHLNTAEPPKNAPRSMRDLLVF